ncbi:PKD domain-containing protein, partial [Halorubrum sp. SS5]
MTTRREQVGAVSFSVLMLVSMVASSVAFGGLAAADRPDVAPGDNGGTGQPLETGTESGGNATTGPNGTATKAGNETAAGTDANGTDAGASVRGNDTASEPDGDDGNASVNGSADAPDTGDSTTTSDGNTTTDSSEGPSARNAVTKCQTLDSGGTYRLATDNITETSGTCIEITAPGVTFDGDGNVIKDGTYDVTAVSISADDVVVKNLTVREVGTAVDLNGASNGRIANVNVEDDFGGVNAPSTGGTAISVSGGSNNTLRDNGIFDPGKTSGDGILISDSTANLVVNNEISAPFDAGIELRNADDNNVSKNEISGAGLGSRNSDAGIRIGDFDGNPGDDNYLFDNDIYGNGFTGTIPELATGIVVRAGTGNELDTNNVREAAGTAVVVADDGTTLVDNAITENGENGIFVDDAASNVNLTDNTVRYAGREDGSAGVDVRGSGTTVVGNTIEYGDGRGLYVTSDASVTEVENNTVRLNDGYAIDAEASVRAVRTRLGSGASWITVDGTGYAIDDGSKPATLPEKRQDIGIYLDVDGADGIDEIRTKYRDDAVSTVDESTLRLWQYDGSWAQSSDTGVDTDDDIVSGNTTLSGGTVAPLANNTLPTADATVSSTSLAPNESVTFDASGSADPDGEIVEYRWDFDGDGSTERTTRSPTVTYQYSQTGDFDAAVTVADDGDDTDSTMLSVSVNEQPIAELSVSPSPTSIDANTTLNASNSTFAYGAIDEYRWDFDGDGTVDETTTEPTANRTYPTTGDVSPTVTVVGDDDTNATASGSLAVQENLPPTGTEGNSGLSFTCNRGFSPDCTNWVGDDVSPFTQNFADPDGEIVEYRWDFDGDGAVEETTSRGSTSHAYTETGTYALTVTLVDDDGGTLSTTNDISITERKTGRIAGTVTNASGDPVANATVIVYRDGGFDPYDGTTTNATGAYELPDVGADDSTYNVTVDPAGYEAAFRERSVAENATETADFQLDATDADPGSGSVLLTVEDSDGSPIADATVEVRNRTGVVTTDTTDGNGQTSYISLSATHHSLRVKKSGYETTTAVAAVSNGSTSFVTAVLETDPAPFFDVRIDSTNEPVTEGETLSVTATINNTGERSGTQSIALSVNNTQRDSTTVSLGSGETETVSLEWPTDVGDADPYAAIVASDNDSAPTSVVVREAAVPASLSGLDIATQGQTATVETTETVPVSVAVENTGTVQSSYTPTLTITNSSGTVAQRRATTPTLDPGDNETVSFSLPAPSPGEYTVEIATDGNATTGSLDVTSGDDTAPVLSDASAVARDDRRSVVRDDDVVEVSVNVSDPGGNGINSVTADASGFGAGTVSLSETNTEGVYQGTFTVNASKTRDSSERLRVTATNGAGETNATRTRFALTLDTQPPVASATANRTTVAPGEPVRFNASGSTDDNFRGPDEHRWDFDADGTDEARAFFDITDTVTYTYAAPGTYSVELTVSDSAGNTNTTTLTIDVRGANQTPTAAYDFEGTGSTVVDRTGNGYTGELNGANRTPGRNGTVLSFDGSSYAQLGSAETLNPRNGSYSVSLWFKTDGVSGPNSVLFAKRGGDNERVKIALHNNGSGEGTVGVGFKDDPGLDNDGTRSSETYTDGTWHRVLVVRDVGTDSIELYVDGELVGSTTDTQDDINPTAPAYLGAQPEYPNDRYYTGQLDDVKVYKRSLDPGEERGAVPVDVDPSDLDGNGSESNPYEISNASELQAMEDDLDANYTLVEDINASNTAQWNNGNGFAPVGGSSRTSSTPPFTGSLDGNNHTVTGLTIDRSDERYIGLFGESTERVSNLSLTDLTITGNDFVGGLVGRNDGGDITDATASGSVTGSEAVGGLVGGNNGGNITSAAASGSVTGEVAVGGLVGGNGGNITSATASSSVTGEVAVGGLIGGNGGGAIRNATASSSVTGSTEVGGLVGRNVFVVSDSVLTGTIRDTFTVGPVSGGSELGGVVGNNTVAGRTGTITDSYWDTQATNQSNSAGNATGLATAQMQGEAARTNM